MNKNDDFFDQQIKQRSSVNAPSDICETETLEADGDNYDDTRSDCALSQAELTDESTTVNDLEMDVIEPPVNASPSTPSFGEQNQILPPEARRAFVNLLRRMILSSQKPKLFESICRYKDDIRLLLANMNFKLVLDDKNGLAFVKEVTDDVATEETVSLIPRRTLSLYDTLLLLVLRKHYQERETAGEQKVVIDIERIESNLTPFLPLTNSSKGDRKKLNAALERMVEKQMLNSVRGSDDRYEITPIIRYVVDAEFLEKILFEYNKLACEASDSLEHEV